jgi:hypothetical protein
MQAIPGRASRRAAPRCPSRPARRLGALCALALMAAGCGGSEPARATPGGDGGSPVTAPEGAPDARVDAARADLAQRLGAEPASIELVSVREVTWRDGSLGCPKPGMSYKQVLVNGSQIVLRHDGVDYHYHAGGARGPFYCPDPQEPLAGGDGDR